MVYPHEHVLLRFNGHFGSTPLDKWSAGLRIGLAGAAPAYDAAKLQTLVNSAQTAANTLHAQTGVLAGTNCYLDFVTGAQIGVSGKYTPAGQLTVVSPTTSTAGLGTPNQPWNSALVVSLRTAIPRGRGSNGRLYWPAVAVTIDPLTGRIIGTTVDTRLSYFKTFIDAVNTAANTYSAGARVVVASAVGGGLIAPVTAIRGDGRLDSIERRENDQPSTWYTKTLA